MRLNRLSLSFRKIQTSSYHSRGKFDFIQTTDAISANYERMGFRLIGNKIVDTSNVVNAVALQQYQSQYSIPATLQPNLPFKAGS